MNRRRGARSLFKKPDFAQLFASLKQLRLPVLSKKNRKKLKLFTRAQSEGVRDGSLDLEFGEDAAAAQARPPRSKTHPRLSGLARWTLGVLAFLAPVAAALAAFTVPLLGVRAYEYVMQSGYFHVREVLVEHVTQPGYTAPEPHLAREELLKIAGIDAGTHVLGADVDAMTQRLSDHPWIRWARIDRELPDTLVVHVVEHQPTAFLAADELYLVDELGVPFAVAPADFTMSLPVISGIETERLSDPKESPAIGQQLAAALNILRIWEAQGLARRYPVGELRLQGGGTVALVLEGKTVGNATEIVLGRGPFREKLFRVEWVLEHLRSIGKTADYILLDLGDDAPDSIEMGGARVVVKTDLGPESADTAGRRPAPVAEPTAAATPDAATTAGMPTAPAHPTDAHEPPSGPHAAPSANPANIPESNEPDADLEGAEAAPVSGGRPADDNGQE